MRRILIIITSGQIGGAQVYVERIARFLKEGWDVHVAVGDDGTLPERLADRGIVVHKVPALIKSISILKDFSAYSHILRLIDELKPALVFCNSSKAGFLGRLAAHKRKVSAIFVAHGWAFTEGVPVVKRFIYLLLERMAASWAGKIICVSEFDRTLALQKKVANPDKLVTIHNGLPDTDYIEHKGKDDSFISFVMVARFSAQKDHESLLHAMALLPGDLKIKLFLVGNGETLAQMQALVQELGIAEKVVFMGERDDVEQLLQTMQVFVLSTCWEGFPFSILEAMRAGLPVIASDVGGVSEAVIQDATGILVKREDASALTSAIARLAADAKLRVRMGSCGRELFLEKFSADMMCVRTAELIDSVTRVE